jgi:hypothetical protein
VGACGNRSVVSKQRWARALRVHGCGSVHTVVELRNDVRDLHHLTEHYLETKNRVSGVAGVHAANGAWNVNSRVAR